MLEPRRLPYGSAVRRYLGLAIDAFRGNRPRAKACTDSLGIEDTAMLRRGIRVLRTFVAG